MRERIFLRTEVYRKTTLLIPAFVVIKFNSAMSRKKILIVDDDAVIRTGLASKLQHHGFDALMAVDGSEAVSTARLEHPALILLDITFPPDVAHGGGVPWDGFLIMDWLRRIDETKDIPIIVITGGAPEKFKDRALAKGAAAFFHKPIPNDELLAQVKRLIGEGAPPPLPPGL